MDFFANFPCRGILLVVIVSACTAKNSYTGINSAASTSGTGTTLNAPQALYDFGGMFGYSNVPPPAGSTSPDWSQALYGNPALNPTLAPGTSQTILTGPRAAPSSLCPTGYTVAHILGTPNIDWDLYFCYRAAAPNPIYDFGGMYGFGTVPDPTNSAQVDELSYNNAALNPATATSLVATSTYGTGVQCPTNYTPTKVLGTRSTDWPINFCAELSTGTPIFFFGGAYGYGADSNGNPVDFPNPITGAMSCPTDPTTGAAYQVQQTFGTQGFDYPVYYCYLPNPAALQSF